MNAPAQIIYRPRYRDCRECDGTGGSAGVARFPGSPYGEPTWTDCDYCEDGKVPAECETCGLEAPLSDSMCCEGCEAPLTEVIGDPFYRRVA